MCCCVINGLFLMKSRHRKLAQKLAFHSLLSSLKLLILVYYLLGFCVSGCDFGFSNQMFTVPMLTCLTTSRGCGLVKFNHLRSSAESERLVTVGLPIAG